LQTKLLEAFGVFPFVRLKSGAEGNRKTQDQSQRRPKKGLMSPNDFH
jgi:hypothetical protein